MASPAVNYARDNQQRFLNELKDLLRIPSVSTLPEHKSRRSERAAEFVAAELRRIGMENVEVIPTKGHPLVYADWLHAPGKPTVLVLRRTTTCSRPIRSTNGSRRPSSPPSATAISTPAARSTTKASCGCRSRPRVSAEGRNGKPAHQCASSLRRRRRSWRRGNRELCAQGKAARAEGRFRSGLRHRTVCARTCRLCALDCAA